MLFALQLLVFGLATWVGLYLVGNDVGQGRQWIAALAVLDLACAVALTILRPDLIGLRWATAMVVASATLWIGALLALLPGESGVRRRLNAWRFGLLPVASVLIIALIVVPQYAAIWGRLALIGVVFPLLLANAAVFRNPSELLSRDVRWLLALATAFYVVSVAALVLVDNDIWGRWFVAGATFDLSMLGLVAVAIHAHRQGERVFADFVRSFTGALVAALLFGGPVLLTMATATGFDAAMTALLLTVLFLAIAGQTLNDSIQLLLDRVAFRRVAGLPEERHTLRATAASIPRRDEGGLPALSDDEFVRVTRRALSNLGNLPKLAASPLTRLPAVDAQLAAARLDDNTLTRAAELKRLLLDAIDALKPADAAHAGGFSPAEVWRFYNVLYYPYVIGIKPYRRQPATFDLTPDAQAALDWLRIDVPERTLYNWQNAAAELVARHLREM